MKGRRMLAILALTAVTVMFGGCATEQEAEPSTTKTQEETLSDNKGDSDNVQEDAQEEETVSGVEGGTDESRETTDDSQDQLQTVTVYTVDSAEKLQKQEIVAEEKTPEALWKALANCAVVPVESQVVSMQSDGDQIQLDVSSEFGDYFRSLGTGGEQNVISCVVNSYLDTFNSSRIKITEEGNVLVSGHKEYTDFMEKAD